MREVSNLLLLTYRPHVFLLLYSMYVRTNSSLRHSFKAYDPREGRPTNKRDHRVLLLRFYAQAGLVGGISRGPVTVLEGLLVVRQNAKCSGILGGRRACRCPTYTT